MFLHALGTLLWLFYGDGLLELQPHDGKRIPEPTYFAGNRFSGNVAKFPGGREVQTG